MCLFIIQSLCTNLSFTLSTTVIATGWSFLYVASFTGQRINTEQQTNTNNLKTVQVSYATQ